MVGRQCKRPLFKHMFRLWVLIVKPGWSLYVPCLDVPMPQHCRCHTLSHVPFFALHQPRGGLLMQRPSSFARGVSRICISEASALACLPGYFGRRLTDKGGTRNACP